MSNVGKIIPVSKAKSIAIEYGYDEVIITAAHYNTGTQSVATYGTTQAACENAARGGNSIKRLLGWEENLCNAKPPRQIKRENLQKENDELRRLLSEFVDIVDNQHMNPSSLVNISSTVKSSPSYNKKK